MGKNMDQVSDDLWKFVFASLDLKDLGRLEQCNGKFRQLVESLVWQGNKEALVQYFSGNIRIKQWIDTPHCFPNMNYRPETKSVAIVGDTRSEHAQVFFGGLAGDLWTCKPHQTSDEWQRVSTIAMKANVSVPVLKRVPGLHNAHLLAVGIARQQENVVLYDWKKDEVVYSVSHPYSPIQANATWQSDVISQIAFQPDKLYSSSLCGEAAVMTWDLETGRERQRFRFSAEEQRAREPALYGTRGVHETTGLCVPDEGPLFVSSSYRFVYQWDERTPAAPVRRLEFYSAPSEPPEGAPQFFMNQESAYPLSSLGFPTPRQDRLTVIGKRKAKVQTFMWPSLEPIPDDEPEFQLDFEPSDVFFSPYALFAVDFYGTWWLVPAKERGKWSMKEIRGHMGGGCKACDVLGDTWAIAYSNPQSGWGGCVGACICLASGEQSAASDPPASSHKHKCVLW